MIEDFCRDIYNIGVDLKCGPNISSCLCPTKSAYEYLCYQCNMAQKKSLQKKEHYELVFRPKSGKIIINHRFKREVFCSSQHWQNFGIINVVVEDALKEINSISEWQRKCGEVTIKSVAMALTHAKIFRTNEVSYINLSNAFDINQFINYFWNMIAVIMCRIHKGKNCNKLWSELSHCLSDIEVIYGQRQQIGTHYENYVRSICEGLENTKHKPDLYNTFFWQQRRLIDKKSESQDLLEFMFWHIDNNGVLIEYDSQGKIVKDFIKMCIVLKEFLKRYQEQYNIINLGDYRIMNSVLDMFTMGQRIDMACIEEFGETDFACGGNWRGKAKRVSKYLDRVKVENRIEEYTLSRV